MVNTHTHTHTPEAQQWSYGVNPSMTHSLRGSPGRHRGWLPFPAIATPLALSAQTQTWFCKGTALLAFSHVIIPLSPVNSLPTQTNGPAHSS